MKSLNELNLSNKKYIIFDMDGTLIDSIGIWNWTDQELIKDFAGVSVDLEEIQVARDNFLHTHQDGDIYLDWGAHLIKKYNFSLKDPQKLLDIRWDISNIILENELDFKPDAAPLILELKKMGYILVLATMTTQVQLDVYSKKNKKMLQQMNIAEVFDLITKKEDVKNKKPHPEIYNRIMQHYNANPNECLIFEDSFTGVLAGRNAGVEVVNIYDKYADVNRDKINSLADYSIMNYKEFLNYLK